MEEALKYMGEMALEALSGIDGLVFWSSIREASRSFAAHFNTDGIHFLDGTFDAVTSKVRYTRRSQ